MQNAKYPWGTQEPGEIQTGGLLAYISLAFIIMFLSCSSGDIRLIALAVFISAVSIYFGYNECILSQNPYMYPVKSYKIFITGKRNVDYMSELDSYLIENGIDSFLYHYNGRALWDKTCRDKIKAIGSSRVRELRSNQFLAAKNQTQIFKVQFIREHTRYKQVNYVRHAYIVQDLDHMFPLTMQEVQSRYEQLEAIDFECTLKEYNTKNQRKLMTQKLRNEIKVRDNYTCQICGKYMPDGVGLHIDHIVPISKGGKTVPSNLQVLCSNCNLTKSDKL